jgi:hypothetical protein
MSKCLARTSEAIEPNALPRQFADEGTHGWNGLAISNHLATYGHGSQMESVAGWALGSMF